MIITSDSTKKYWLEVRPPDRGDTSDRDATSNQRCYLNKVSTSNWRSHLWLEPSLGYWQEGWLGCTSGATQGYTCLHATVQRGWSNVGTRVHMHTCTFACTHSHQGLWPEEKWLEHAYMATLEPKFLLWSGVDMQAYTDACTHSKQGVGPEEGWLRPACGVNIGHTCFHTIMQWGWVDVGGLVTIHVFGCS